MGKTEEREKIRGQSQARRKPEQQIGSTERCRGGRGDDKGKGYHSSEFIPLFFSVVLGTSFSSHCFYRSFLLLSQKAFPTVSFSQASCCCFVGRRKQDQMQWEETPDLIQRLTRAAGPTMLLPHPKILPSYPRPPPTHTWNHTLYLALTKHLTASHFLSN